MSERESTQVSDMGARKYRERIHRDSKHIDDHSNLPFKFSKPRKEKTSSVLFVCTSCGHESCINEDTLIVICGGCKNFEKVKYRKPAEQY